jgi:hypothetical protein
MYRNPFYNNTTVRKINLRIVVLTSSNVSANAEKNLALITEY